MPLRQHVMSSMRVLYACTHGEHELLMTAVRYMSMHSMQQLLLCRRESLHAPCKSR